ncbi:IgGFc-binding protein-like [Mauremys mutica]|uniref:IgGFc-binding protein-like n=1 Tax=Mauremys mutica TaxID=74926 RepID=UPI001D15EE23|nr:IgGFc-binding protein-like [Mauremys mutica]
MVACVHKCHPFGSATCSASCHPHYLSFDGVSFDFQGTCTYILAKTCTNASHLTPFTISIEKESWGSGNISMAKLVSVQVYGITLTLLQNIQGLIMVDGVFHNLPVITANRRLQAYQHGTNILVQTDCSTAIPGPHMWPVWELQWMAANSRSAMAGQPLMWQHLALLGKSRSQEHHV